MKLDQLYFGFSNPRVILIAIISVILFVPSQTLHQNGDNLSSMEFYRLLNLVGSHPYSATSTSTLITSTTTTTTPKPPTLITSKPTFSSEKVKPMMEFLRAVKSLPPLTPEISMDERRQQLLQSLSLLNSLIDKVSIPDDYNNEVTEGRSESRLSTEIVRPPTTTTSTTTMKPTTPRPPESTTKLLPEKINDNTGAIQQLSILNALLGGNGNANSLVDNSKSQQISEQQAQNAAQAALLTNFLIGLGGGNQQQQPQQQSAQNFQSFQNTGLNLDAASSDQVNGLLSLLGNLGSLGNLGLGQQTSTANNLFSSLLQQPQQQSAQQPNLLALLGSNGGLQQNPGLIESLANLASVVANPYPSRPKVRGIDTRFGLGYRLGENADVQVVWEVGPQLFTDPLPNEVKARQIPQVNHQNQNQQNALASVQIPLVQKLTQSRGLEDVINVKNIESKKQEDSKVETPAAVDGKAMNFKDKPWPPPTVIEMRSGEMLDDYAVPVREFYQNRPKQMILPPQQPRPYFNTNNNRFNRSPYNNNNNNRRFSSHPTPRYPNPLHSPNSQLTQYEKWLIQMSQNKKQQPQQQQQQQQMVQPNQHQHFAELRPQPIIERRIRRRKLLDNRVPKTLDKKLSTNRFFKRSSLPIDDETSAGRDDSTYDDDDYADGSDQNDSQYDDDDYEDEKPSQKPNSKRPVLKMRPNRPLPNRPPQQKQQNRPPPKQPHRRPGNPQDQAPQNKQQSRPVANNNRMDMNMNANNQMPPGRRRISGNNQDSAKRPASIPGPTDPERIAMFNRQRQKLPTHEEVNDSFIRRNTMAHQIKLEEIQQRNKQMLEAQNQRRNDFLTHQHHRNKIPNLRPPPLPKNTKIRGSNNKDKILDKKPKPDEEEYTVISNNKRIPSLSDPTLTESIMEKIQEYIPEKIKSTSSEIKEGILSKMPSLPQVPSLPLMTNITRFFHMGSNVLNVQAYGQVAPGNNRHPYKDQVGSGSANILKKSKPIVMIGEDISYKEIAEQLTKESNKTRNNKKPGEKLQSQVVPSPTPVETLLDPKSDPRPEVYIDIATGEVSVMRPVGELKSFLPETTTPTPVLDDVSEQTDEAFQEKDKQLFFQLQKNLHSYYEKVKLDKLKTIEAQKKKQANANHLQNYSSYFDLIETRRKRMMNGDADHH